MPGPVRTVIGHGRILAHPHLPVETLWSSLAIGTGTRGDPFNARPKIFYGCGASGPEVVSAGSMWRRRCRATRSRLPQTSLEHQRLRRPREVSR